MSELKLKKITSTGTCAILFARNPVAGQVKTRLQSHLSPDQVMAVYTGMLLDSAVLLGNSSATRRVVASADAEGVEGLRALLDPTGEGGLEFVVQQGNDLGQRMEQALSEAFTSGAGRALILGTDAPSLPATIIDDALERLTGADLVIGPCVDGGYYLVGLAANAFAAAAPALFRAIAWSTGTVLQQSVKRLGEGLTLSLLPPWYDIDHPQDAAFLRSHLEAMDRAGQQVSSHSLKVLRGLDLPPPS